MRRSATILLSMLLQLPLALLMGTMLQQAFAHQPPFNLTHAGTTVEHTGNSGARITWHRTSGAPVGLEYFNWCRAKATLPNPLQPANQGHIVLSTSTLSYCAANPAHSGSGQLAGEHAAVTFDHNHGDITGGLTTNTNYVIAVSSFHPETNIFNLHGHSAVLTFTTGPNGAPRYGGPNDPRRRQALSFQENTPPHTAIGDPVRTDSDPDGDTVYYTLAGADAGKFTIGLTDAIIRTVPRLYDYEDGQRTFTLTVQAADRKDRWGNADTLIDDTVSVTISLTDYTGIETPSPLRMDPPGPTDGAIRISWTQYVQEANKPAWLWYVIRIKDGPGFLNPEFIVPGGIDTTSYTWTGLTNGREYEIGVEACNHEGCGGDPVGGRRVATPAAAGVAVSATSPFEVRESSSNSYTLRLKNQPAAAVTIVLGKSGSGDVTVSPAQLTFTRLNWNTSQTVTVSAMEDGDTAHERAHIAYTMTTADADYAALTPGGLAIHLLDNDVTFSPQTIPDQSYTVGTPIAAVTLPASTGGVEVPSSYALKPALPAGLFFDAGARVLVGVPSTATANTAYTYTATAAGSAAAGISLTFNLEVLAATMTSVFITGADTAAVVDGACSPLLRTGGLGPALTALTAHLVGERADPSWQWYRGVGSDGSGGKAIRLASSATYVPKAEDAGLCIGVGATVGSVETRARLPVGVHNIPPRGSDPWLSVRDEGETGDHNPPSLGGSARILKTFYIISIIGPAFDRVYHWERTADDPHAADAVWERTGTGTNIYTLKDDDAGYAFRLYNTWRHRSSGITVPSLPPNLGNPAGRRVLGLPPAAPAISGAVRAGGTLSATVAAAPVNHETVWQWYRHDTAGSSGTTINGADRAVYTLQSADIGKYISVGTRYRLSEEPGRQTAQTRSPLTAAVAAPLAFASIISELTFTAGTAVAVTLPAATGGIGGKSYSLSPFPPAGLSFEPATRVLSGKPVEVATASYTYTAADTGKSISLTFTIAVSGTPLPALPGMTVRPGFSRQLVAAWSKVSTTTLPAGLTLSHYTLESRVHGTAAGFRNCGRVNDAAATQGICSPLTNGTTYELKLRAVDTAGVLGVPSTATGVPQPLYLGFDKPGITVSGRSSATISLVASHPPPQPFAIRLQGGVGLQNQAVKHGGRPLVRYQWSVGLQNPSSSEDNLNTVLPFGPATTTVYPITVTALNRPIKGRASWEIFLIDQIRAISVGRGGLYSRTSIEINPQPPTAVAGADLTFRAGNYARLDGSQSLTDTGDVCCPTPELSSLAFAWEQVGGPTVTLAGANTAIAGFLAPSPATGTTLTFRLTVTDDTPVHGNIRRSDSDEVRITVPAVPAVLTASISGALTVMPDTLTIAIGDALTVSGGTLPAGATGATIAYEWWRSEDDASFQPTDTYVASTASYTAAPADGGYWLIPAARLGSGGARSDNPVFGEARRVAPPDMTFNLTLPDSPVAGATVWKTGIDGDTTHASHTLEYRFQSRTSTDTAWQAVSVQFSPSGTNPFGEYPGNNQPIPQSLAGHQLRTEVRYVGANGLTSINPRIVTSTAVLSAAPSGVVLNGTLERGMVLNAAVTPAVPPNHEAVYQWYRHTGTSDAAGNAIAGATAMAYTPVAADVNRYLSVAVRYRLNGGERTTTKTHSTISAKPVINPLEFQPASFDDQVLIRGSAVVLTLPEATGGRGGKTYTLAPNLPAGLSFTSDMRLLAGTPASATAASVFTYSATDEEQTGIALNFTITVNPVLGFGTQTIGNQTYAVGTTITALMLPAATGGRGDKTYTLTPSLPAGLSFDAAARVLSGTPDVVSALSTYTYTAFDDSGDTPRLIFTMAVLDLVLSVGPAQGREGDSLTFTASLNKAGTHRVTVDYATRIGSAGADDFGAATGTLIFSPGETSKTFTVAVTDDAIVEGNETFTVVLSNPANAVLPVAGATGTITNDDNATLRLTPTGVQVNERAGMVTVFVQTTATLAVPVTFNVRTLAGSATAPQDYVVINQRLTIPRNSMRTNLDIPIINDVLSEGDETFTVEINDIGGQPVVIGSPRTVTVTIISDDATFDTRTIGDQTYVSGIEIPALTLPEAVRGTGGKNYTLTPSLPAGLSFAGRVLSGTPAELGAFALTYTVTDNTGYGVTRASLFFTVTVNPALGFGTQTIGNQTYAVGTTITDLTLPAATGGIGGKSYSLSPPLSAGLSFDPATRVLSGKPVEVATASYIYTAADTGSSASLSFTIAVRGTPLPALPGMTVRPGFSRQLVAAWSKVSTATLPAGLTLSHYTLESRVHGTAAGFRNCGRVNDAAATQGICSPLTNGTTYELRLRAVDTAGVLGVPSTATGVPQPLYLGFDKPGITISGRSSATISLVASHPPPQPFTIRLQEGAELQHQAVEHGGRPLVRYQWSVGLQTPPSSEDNINTVLPFGPATTTAYPITVTALNKPIKRRASWNLLLTDRDPAVSVGRGGLYPEARIEINPQPPTAVAGADLTFKGGNYVRLDGSQSLTDTGDVCCPIPELSSLAFAWEQVGGSTVTLAGANTAIAGFLAPSPTTRTVLTFRLTVTDDTPVHGNIRRSDSDEVRITIPAVPTVLVTPTIGILNIPRPLTVMPDSLTIAIGDSLTVSGGTLPAGATSATIAYEWWRSEDNASFQLTDSYVASTAAYTAAPADGGYWLLPAARVSSEGARSATPMLSEARRVAPPDVTFSLTLPDNPVAGATVWKTGIDGDTTSAGHTLEYRFQSRASTDTAWQALSVRFSQTGTNPFSEYPGNNQPIPQSLAGHQLRTEVRYVGANGLTSINPRIVTSTAVLSAAPSGVTLNGTLERGMMLNAVMTPAVPPNHEVVCQWYRHTGASDAAGSAIAGATAVAYTPVAADVGRHLSAAVRYRLNGSERTTAETRSTVSDPVSDTASGAIRVRLRVFLEGPLQ